MRNIFVHEYFGIDTKIVWDIINKNMPELKASVKNMLDNPE